MLYFYFNNSENVQGGPLPDTENTKASGNEITEFGRLLTRYYTAAGYTQERFCEAMTAAGYPLSLTRFSIIRMRRDKAPVVRPPFWDYARQVLNLTDEQFFQLFKAYASLHEIGPKKQQGSKGATQPH